MKLSAKQSWNSDTFIKRSSFTLRNRSVSDVKSKREAWKKHMPGNGVNYLVFLDESGVNTNMTRHYARSKTNERAVDSTPVNTPCSTTVLSSIRLDKKTAHTVYQGGTTAECFAEYLKDILLPILSGKDIIMDNMCSHHAKAVKEVLDSVGIKYFYLPPYSPDLNPIEKMWSKIKAYLRKPKVRIASELPGAIEKAFSTVCSSDCLGGSFV